MIENGGEAKCAEQIPPNPLDCTEFLPMYTSIPPSKPHFSPQNLLSLFLQSSTFGFIFCAIIYSLLFAIFGVYLSQIITLKTVLLNNFVTFPQLYSLICSTAELRGALHASPPQTQQNNHADQLTTPLLPHNSSGITGSGRPPLPWS